MGFSCSSIMDLNHEYKFYHCQFCNQLLSNGIEYRFHIREHIALFSGNQEQSINRESSYKETDVESDGVNGHSIKKSLHFEKSSSSSSEDGKSNGWAKPEFENVVRKKRSFTRYNNRHANPNNDHEVQEVAFGLLMLSKGLRDSDVIKVKNVLSTNYGFDASVDESMLTSKNVVRSNSEDVRVKGKRKAYDDQKDHKCWVCFKEFGSGQALGGHMRAHYQGITSNETGHKEYTTDSFKVRRRLDFSRDREWQWQWQ